MVNQSMQHRTKYFPKATAAETSFPDAPNITTWNHYAAVKYTFVLTLSYTTVPFDTRCILSLYRFDTKPKTALV